MKIKTTILSLSSTTRLFLITCLTLLAGLLLPGTAGAQDNTLHFTYQIPTDANLTIDGSKFIKDS